MHSSSAHVYINDLYQALKNGVFDKIDMNGNKITTIKGIELKIILGVELKEILLLNYLKNSTLSFLLMNG